jgi:hypothetical protein
VSAVATACRPDVAIEPDPANHDRYSAVYERYRTAVASATLHTGAGSAQGDAGGRG